MGMLFDEEYIAKTYRRDLIQEGTLNTLRRLLPATSLSLEQALNLLDVPECDRLTYRENLRELWAPPFSQTKNRI